MSERHRRRLSVGLDAGRILVGALGLCRARSCFVHASDEEVGEIETLLVAARGDDRAERLERRPSWPSRKRTRPRWRDASSNDRVRRERLLEGLAGFEERGRPSSCCSRSRSISRGVPGGACLAQAHDGRERFGEHAACEEQLLVPREALEPRIPPSAALRRGRGRPGSAGPSPGTSDGRTLAPPRCSAAARAPARRRARERADRSSGRARRRSASGRRSSSSRSVCSMTAARRADLDCHWFAGGAMRVGAVAQCVELPGDLTVLEARQLGHGRGAVPGRVLLEQLRVGSGLSRRGQRDGGSQQTQDRTRRPTGSWTASTATRARPAASAP